MGQRKIPVTLKATIRQKSGDGSGQPFSVIEEDDEHDIALCRIEGFKVYTPDKSPSVQAFRKSKDPNRTDTTHPFASLGISDSLPDVGRFVVVSGFPLGSWTPTIQPGMVSATQTIYPSGPVAGVPKGTRDLLQITVSGNHGNSGGPVIDTCSGKVVGVILQLVPAPLAINGQHYDAGTFDMSGIMLAAPASWVGVMLKKHHLVSESTASGHFVIW
jgi:S1-C subfamily serine protease